MISFESRYLEFVDKVYWYILRKVRNTHEAEDLTSQTFIKAYQSYSKLKDQERFAPWIFKIAHNLTMDFFRHSKRYSGEDPDWLQSEKEDLLSNAINSELSRQIQTEIQKLSKEELDLLDLRFVAQLTFKEMATVLQRNESTLKKQYYKIIIKLRNKLEEK
jgi:RNA polymerase sigma-70 factor (ECF subfamily)